MIGTKDVAAVGSEHIERYASVCRRSLWRNCLVGTDLGPHRCLQCPVWVQNILLDRF